MQSNLALRVLSALILAPIVLGAVFYGSPAYNCLLAAMGAGLAWEWEQMLLKRNSTVGIIITATAAITAFLTAENPSAALLVILIGTCWAFWKSKRNISLTFGTLYICLPIFALSYIYYINENISREIVLWLLFVVWATDIGGYVVGKSVGGPKLAPRVSAKKTWSGLLGAIGFACFVAYVFALYLKAYDYLNEEAISFSQIKWVLIVSAGVLAVVSQMGDLFESFIKRKLNLKDSSNLIPGHGGLFDRVDGLLFASVATALVLFAVNQGWPFE